MDGHADDETLERLKAWWKTYGNALLLGIALGLAILFGHKYWSQYKQERAETASAIYEELLEHYRQKEFDAVREASGKLIDDYASTPYAGLAAMIVARIDLEGDKREAGREQLRWAMEHATDGATRQVARLRLARVLADANEIDPALALLDIDDTAGFELDYYELRGDLHETKGNKQAARNAYQQALKHVDDRSSYRPILNMKLDDLGPSESE